MTVSRALVRRKRLKILWIFSRSANNRLQQGVDHWLSWTLRGAGNLYDVGERFDLDVWPPHHHVAIEVPSAQNGDPEAGLDSRSDRRR